MVPEILGGELRLSPRPALPHAAAASALGEELGPPFKRGRGGPGGWLILHEPELHLGGDILVPDLAAWRRERLPVVPREPYLTLSPDWVCEVSCPSTEQRESHGQARHLCACGGALCLAREPRSATARGARAPLRRLGANRRLSGERPRARPTLRRHRARSGCALDGCGALRPFHPPARRSVSKLRLPAPDDHRRPGPQRGDKPCADTLCSNHVPRQPTGQQGASPAHEDGRQGGIDCDRRRYQARLRGTPSYAKLSATFPLGASR